MTNMTGSKLSIFLHPGKITGYWITTRSFQHKGHDLAYDVKIMTSQQRLSRIVTSTFL
jgi:hypothetical protein